MIYDIAQIFINFDNEHMSLLLAQLLGFINIINSDQCIVAKPLIYEINIKLKDLPQHFNVLSLDEKTGSIRINRAEKSEAKSKTCYITYFDENTSNSNKNDLKMIPKPKQSSLQSSLPTILISSIIQMASSLIKDVGDFKNE